MTTSAIPCLPHGAHCGMSMTLPGSGARLRECTSNGVRHAGATELYADSEHRPQAWHLCITNNGTPPRAEIKEGGGLSSLRRRIEKAGGTVTVHSLPVFVLEVTLPDKESIYDARYDR